MNYHDWEDAVYTALEAQDMTRSDAQGVVEGQVMQGKADLTAAYNAGIDPISYADAILMLATV